MCKEKTPEDRGKKQVEMEIVRVEQGFAYWAQWTCFILGGTEVIEPWGMTVRELIEAAFAWFGV